MLDVTLTAPGAFRGELPISQTAAGQQQRIPFTSLPRSIYQQAELTCYLLSMICKDGTQFLKKITNLYHE